MEMHAVAREDVESILEAAGARLLDVRRTHHCGPLWLAFRYDVTREAGVTIEAGRRTRPCPRHARVRPA